MFFFFFLGGEPKLKANRISGPAPHRPQEGAVWLGLAHSSVPILRPSRPLIEALRAGSRDWPNETGLRKPRRTVQGLGRR